MKFWKYSKVKKNSKVKIIWNFENYLKFWKIYESKKNSKVKKYSKVKLNRKYIGIDLNPVDMEL